MKEKSVQHRTMSWDMLLRLFAVLLLSSHGLAMSCDSIASQYDQYTDFACLISNGNVSMPYKPTADDIKMIPNENGSTLEVQFPLALNSELNVYEVNLSIKENEDDEESCKSFNKTTEAHRHSKQIFDVFRCKDINSTNCAPTCTRYGSVTFQLIYTGCYFVWIHTVKQMDGIYKHGIDFSSKSMVIQTNYKKRTAWQMKPMITPQCYPHASYVRVTINYDFLQEIPMAIKLREKIDPSEDDACLKTGTHHSCCAVGLHSGQLKCERKEISNSAPVCEMSKTPPNTIACIFYGVKPGNYCVSLEPIDKIRCSGTRSVFTVENGKIRTCRYQSNLFECKAQVILPEPTVPIQPKGTNIVIVAAAAVSCVLIACVVYFALHRCRASHGPELIPPSTPEVVLLQPKVLLLYAQDCEPFMKLMTTFRRLLTNLGKCEVLDCFDPARAEEVSASPFEWMCHWASNPEVRVVVVASDCAVAHQRAMSTTFSLQYWEPAPFNHLFNVGLKEVMHNHKKKEYLTTFVVRLDDTNLGYLTPYTRFLLPQHLEELLRILNPGVDVTTLREYKDEQKLRDDHRDLIIYKQQNPKYIVNLMTMTNEVV